MNGDVPFPQAILTQKGQQFSDQGPNMDQVGQGLVTITGTPNQFGPNLDQVGPGLVTITGPPGQNQGIQPGQPGQPELDSGSVPLQRSNSSEEFDILSYLESKTGWPRLYLAIGLILVTWFVVIALFGAQVFCSFAAFTYPAYMTYKTLETTETKLHIQWLMYWIVYAMFNMFEFISDTMFSWIPYYVMCKIGFLVWCFLPQTQGSTRIYWMFIQPLLKRNESTIDDALGRSQETTVQALGEIRDVGFAVIFDSIKNAGSSIFSRGKKKQKSQ